MVPLVDSVDVIPQNQKHYDLVVSVSTHLQNMRPSNWMDHLPQGIGLKIKKKHLKNHHEEKIKQVSPPEKKLSTFSGWFFRPQRKGTL